jgi:hypothetical protein
MSQKKIRILVLSILNLNFKLSNKKITSPKLLKPASSLFRKRKIKPSIKIAITRSRNNLKKLKNKSSS